MPSHRIANSNQRGKSLLMLQQIPFILFISLQKTDIHRPCALALKIKLFLPHLLTLNLLLGYSPSRVCPDPPNCSRPDACTEILYVESNLKAPKG